MDKLISIDTPQQTPTSLQPPDNSLSRSFNQNKKQMTKKSSVDQQNSCSSSPSKQDKMANYKKTNLPMSTVNFVKHRPLCLDAAQLEQNLHALKKNSGSVNLNNMNILPPYVNVLTPNKLSKPATESRKIQIDPKKAIIDDLASPPGNEVPNEDVVSKCEAPGDSKLKNSASANSLLNGPLTDLPYADSDNGSSSSSNSGLNIITRMAPATKQNNYTEIILDDQKNSKKQQSSGGGGGSGASAAAGGGFLNNDSEISC